MQVHDGSLVDEVCPTSRDILRWYDDKPKLLLNFLHKTQLEIKHDMCSFLSIALDFTSGPKATLFE